MRRLAIVGYGKMGRAIERCTSSHGFEVVARFDSSSNAGSSGLTRDALAGAEVAIEFSAPQSVVANVLRLCDLGVSAVVGTTGWDDERQRVRRAVESSCIGLVWSANFSIGAQLFARLAEDAARLFASEREFEAWAWEIHHRAKQDAPSGTMRALAQRMREAGYDRPIDIASNRAGWHPGTHEIGFDSSDDTVTLRHTARGRGGFARGALRAAEWVIGRRGFYEFSDVLFGQDGG